MNGRGEDLGNKIPMHVLLGALIWHADDTDSLRESADLHGFFFIMFLCYTGDTSLLNMT